MKKISILKFTITYGIFLAGLTTYVLLDSFVIPHRYSDASVAETDTEVVQEAETDTESLQEAEADTESHQDADTDTGEKKEKSHPDRRPDFDFFNGDMPMPKEHPGKGRSRSGDEEERSEGSDVENKRETSERESSELQIEEAESIGQYHSDGIDISVLKKRVNDTDVYVADVKLESASSLKTALADNTYGRNITEETSVMAAENDAILAVNGDYYGSRQSGYVIREGVLYRDVAKEGNEDLVILKDGSFRIIREEETTAQELIDMGAVQVLSFGPALIENGEIAVDADDEVGMAMRSNPRTAIGVIDDLHYVFVVADGRTSDNAGLTLKELADFMNTLGVETAYNLDGGGSSAMVFQGELINNPTTSGRNISERRVSDIVYIR